MSEKPNRLDKEVEICSEDDNDVSWDPYKCWKYWCRLCAKEERSNIDVFNRSGEKSVPDTTLATAVGKFFWVNIRPDDVLPQYMCRECETLINSLCRFTERVNKVQTMFATLQNSKQNDLFDPNDVRLQYGLVDEDRQHIIPTPSAKVEECDEDSQEDIEVEEAAGNESSAGDLEEFEANFRPKVAADSSDVNDEESIYEDDEEKSVTIEEEDGEDAISEGTQDFDLELVPEDFDEAEVENSDSESHYQAEEFEYVDEDDTLLYRVRKDMKELKKASNTALSHSSSQGEGTDEQDDKRLHEIDEMENMSEDAEFVSENEEVLVKREVLENDGQSTLGSLLESIDGSADVLGVGENSLLQPPKRKRGRPRKSQSGDNSEESAATHKKRRKRGANKEDDEESIQAEYKYHCSECPKKYKSVVVYRKHMLDAHQIVDETVVEYKCDKCPKVFLSERMLASHMRNHLPLEQKQIYPCIYCEKRFTKESILTQHIAGIHFNKKPYICDVCGRALKTLPALREHQLCHTDECPFECEVCHHRFKNKARLKIHSDIHTAEGYKCTVCGQTLSSRRTLSKHMLVHSEIKAYKCDYCGSEFKRTKALKNHLIIHTGMKPYICNFCHKSFTNGSNCRAHKKKAHPAELAAMEAAGIREEPIRIPKLESLIAVSKAVDPKRRDPGSQRSSGGGLPVNWRELLLKAEAKADLLKADSNQSDDCKNDIEAEVEAQLAAMDG